MKIQGQLLTGIGEVLGTTLLGLRPTQRLEAHYQALVRLVDQVLIKTGGLNRDGGVPVTAVGANKIYGGGKIGHVETNTECVWKLGIGEIEANLAPLLLHINTNRRI